MNSGESKQLSWFAEFRSNSPEGIHQIFVDERELIHVIDKCGYSPLQAAIRYKIDDGLVAYLLDNGADPNFRNSAGETCLELAIERNSINLAEALLEAGADLRQIGSNSHSPLHLACVRDHVEIAELLIKRGSNINSGTGEAGETPLMEAAFFGSSKAVKLLVSLGAITTVKSNSIFGTRSTALDLAISQRLYYARSHNNIPQENIEKRLKDYDEIIEILEKAGTKGNKR